jgi:RNA polymerase sigma-70 factor (ECF subfamily)
MESAVAGTELTLADRIRHGDASAEEELFSRFHRRILIMVLARTQDSEFARDTAQDVIVAVLEGLRKGKLNDSKRLGAYVYGVARNLVNNAVRSQKRHPVVALPDESSLEGRSKFEVAIDRRAMAHEVVGSLSREDRIILRMTMVEGLTAEEIGDRLGITPEAARKRKSRALARARASFNRGHEND